MSAKGESVMSNGDGCVWMGDQQLSLTLFLSLFLSLCVCVCVYRTCFQVPHANVATGTGIQQDRLAVGTLLNEDGLPVSRYTHYSTVQHSTVQQYSIVYPLHITVHATSSQRSVCCAVT